MMHCDRLSMHHCPAVSPVLRLSETSSLTLGLEQAENVVLANCERATYYVSTRGLCAGYLRLWKSVLRDWGLFVPGPLTFRMIDRVWSSMNSTRTWVTPPRDPIVQQSQVSHRPAVCDCFSAARSGQVLRTGTAQDTGDLDQLDGLLGCVHFGRCESLVLR